MDPLKGDNSRRSQWALEGEMQEVKAHLEFEISYFVMTVWQNVFLCFKLVKRNFITVASLSRIVPTPVT